MQDTFTPDNYITSNTSAKAPTDSPLIIDGKSVAEKIIKEIKIQTTELSLIHGRPPGLAVVIVGSDPASLTYVKLKKKKCKKAGIKSFEYQFDCSVSQKEILDLISDLNNNNEIDGILCQLPLPKHIDEETIINSIHPNKDVDCFHPLNTGKLMLGQKGPLPCTPAGIIELLNYYKIETQKKHIVVIGRSNIVGKPIALLLSQKKSGNATVTVCHSNTPDISIFTQKADIIILAAGKPFLLHKKMIKKGTVVIDVGTNWIQDKKNPEKGILVGDACFDEIKSLCSAITPVPGGVGPMTIAMLLKSCVEMYINHQS
jgi:methylenetetrahydrofolate dehydrogenase (NADP+)/methenyltetrahydrofolate cyclohydrolase